MKQMDISCRVVSLVTKAYMAYIHGHEAYYC